MKLKKTDLFSFILRQMMVENGWRRIPRKFKKRLLKNYWAGLRSLKRKPLGQLVMIDPETAAISELNDTPFHN
jgi:hypothetical protein